jgi:site-specific recombinase XerD
MRQKRYSATTIATNLSFVRQFFGITGIQPHQVNRERIEQYNYQQFIREKRSYSTQNQWINAIKLYLKVNRLYVGNLDEIERPRKQRKLPNVLSQDEVQAIFQSTTNLKHRTLLMLIYGAGLRIGEALNLKVDDIRSKESLIYIRGGKGKKDRRVPLSAKLLDALRSYYRFYKPKEYLFEGADGGPYSNKSAGQVLKRSVAKAGITRLVTLHTLRHSYATHLTNRGINIQYLQEILGHNSPKTTMLYTHLSGKDISKIKSPLDDMDL